MLRFAPGLIGLFLLAHARPASAGPDDTVWTPLFNGVDLADWDVKVMGYALNVDAKRTWRVADSAIEVNYGNVPTWSGEPWSHAEYRVRPYAYYVLKVEYQFYGTQVPGAPGYANENSGIMIHSQKLSTMALGQNWPISLENQLLGPKSGEGVGSGNLCTPGTAVHNADGSFNNSHCIRASANTRTVAPAWTRSTTVVLGDSLVRHYMEGKAVLTYYKPVQYEGIVSNNTVKIVNNRPLGSGYIQLQSESAPIRFRRLLLANLEGCKSPGSPNYKSYFVKHDSAACNAVSVAGRGSRPAGRLEFLAEGGLLLADVPGAYVLEMRDLSGRPVWTGSGRGRQAFRPGPVGPPGLYALSLKASGAEGLVLRKLVRLP